MKKDVVPRKSKKYTYEDTYQGVLMELFDPEGALEKFARVRVTLCVLESKHHRCFSADNVAAQAYAYFSQRFLNGEKIKDADPRKREKAMDSLRFAVGIPDDKKDKPSGCYKRCSALLERLNAWARIEGLPEVEEADIFPYYTFWEELVSTEFDGRPDRDKHGRIKTKFENGEHLKAFRKELNNRIKRGKKVDFKEIDTIIHERFTKNKPSPKDKASKTSKTRA